MVGNKAVISNDLRLFLDINPPTKIMPLSTIIDIVAIGKFLVCIGG